MMDVVVHCFILLSVVLIQFFIAYGAEMYVSTPERREYTMLSYDGVTATDRLIRFKVKASNNAYVALLSGQTDSDPLYEIDFGGDINTVSFLRAGNSRQYPRLDEVAGPILRFDEYIEFWITWDDNTINVGLGLDVTGPLFLTWTSKTKLWTITNIGISTAFGATGEWIFYTKDQTSTTYGTTSDGTTTDGSTTDGTTTDGTTTDGTTTDDTTTYGTTTYGSTTDGITSDGTTTVGTTTDGTTTDGTPTDGTTTDGTTYDGTTYDGTTHDSTTTVGTTAEGTTADGAATDFQTTKPSDHVSSPTSSAMTFSEAIFCPEYCTKSYTCNCAESSGTTTSRTSVTQYKIDKKILSSYKRRHQSASDPRKSSFYIGCVGITVLVLSVAFIVILDFLPRA